MSQPNRTVETAFQSQQQSVLCANNCGFFGNPSTMNMCSKCYKEHQSKQPAETKEAAVAAPAAVNAADVPAPAAESASKPEQVKKNRCFSCKRKVGVLGFECRCEYVFCSEHRYPNTHNCTVNIKKITQDNLQKQLPKVQTDKFERI